MKYETSLDVTKAICGEMTRHDRTMAALYRELGRAQRRCQHKKTEKLGSKTVCHDCGAVTKRPCRSAAVS